MLTTISLSTAAALLAVGTLLHLRAHGKSRLAYLAFLTSGLGIMTSDIGTVIYEASAVATSAIQGLTDSRDLAQAVPTAIALGAAAFVGWAIIDGRGSIVTAVLAVALPTLLFSVDGQIADGARSFVALIQSLIYSTADGIRDGLTVVTP